MIVPSLPATRGGRTGPGISRFPRVGVPGLFSCYVLIRCAAVACSSGTGTRRKIMEHDNVHVDGVITVEQRLELFVSDFNLRPLSNLRNIRPAVAKHFGVPAGAVQIVALDDCTDWYTDPYGQQWDINVL